MKILDQAQEIRSGLVDVIDQFEEMQPTEREQKLIEALKVSVKTISVLGDRIKTAYDGINILRQGISE